MSGFDELAAQYDAGRLGYSTDLYNMLASFGLSPRDHVLDVACGTGLASRPLIENGFRVTGVDVSEPMLNLARRNWPAATWEAGAAESLPLRDKSFDAAISAQAFHHLDRNAALAELRRVLKPNGLIAIWWKVLGFDDPVRRLRDEVARELGTEQPPSGLAGGFKEFYAADLRDRNLRVIPWHVTVSLERYLVYERSRKGIAEALGPQVQRYYERLEERLREWLGGRPPYLGLGYIQYLYVARTP
jgi:ubiquinone/menaquinone biosynthesis C-methylase UbiE